MNVFDRQEHKNSYNIDYWYVDNIILFDDEFSIVINRMILTSKFLLD
jgi:hypothetical protein